MLLSRCQCRDAGAVAQCSVKHALLGSPRGLDRERADTAVPCVCKPCAALLQDPQRQAPHQGHGQDDAGLHERGGGAAQGGGRQGRGGERQPLPHSYPAELERGRREHNRRLAGMLERQPVLAAQAGASCGRAPSAAVPWRKPPVPTSSCARAGAQRRPGPGQRAVPAGGAAAAAAAPHGAGGQATMLRAPPAATAPAGHRAGPTVVAPPRLSCRWHGNARLPAPLHSKLQPGVCGWHACYQTGSC